jgi:thioredoxin
MSRPVQVLTPQRLADPGAQPMPTVELTAENFDETITRNDFVLVDFWAGWCSPCRVFAPIFERVAGHHPDIVFAKVDTEEQQELSAAFGITSIPTLAIIRERVVIYAQPGALPEPVLEDLIGQARNLDMNEVREQLAAEASGA